MRSATSPNIDDRSLFLSEREVARRLNQKYRDWQAKALILEREGFPRIDPMMNGRYWPAIKAFFSRQYGLSSIEVHQPDGGESLDVL